MNNQSFTLVFASDADRVRLINILQAAQDNVPGEVIVDIDGVGVKIFDPVNDQEEQGGEITDEPITPEA